MHRIVGEFRRSRVFSDALIFDLDVLDLPWEVMARDNQFPAAEPQNFKPLYKQLLKRLQADK